MCFVSCFSRAGRGASTLTVLVFVMEMDLSPETALWQCYAESAIATRYSLRTFTLFTLFVVDCRIDSYALETKTNIP